MSVFNLTAGEKWKNCQTLRVALTLLTRCDVASVPVFAQSALSGSVSVLGRSQWPLTVHNKFSRYHNRVSRAETSHLESPDQANPVTRRTRASSKIEDSQVMSHSCHLLSPCVMWSKACPLYVASIIVIKVRMVCPKLFPSGLWLALKVSREGESVQSHGQ